MHALRTLSAVCLVSLAAGAAWALGVNDIFDLDGNGTDGIHPSLTADRAGFTAAADLKKIDNALLTLSGASDTSVTDNVQRLQKATKQLAKLAKHADIAPDIDEAVATLYAQVYGYNAQGGAAASNYFAGQPINIKNALRLGGVVRAVSKRIAALEATQGSGKHANWKASQRLALFLSVCRASDALIKKYGAVI